MEWFRRYEGVLSVAAYDPWNGGGGVKKNFKRGLVLLAVLLCFMTVVPNRYDKKADAVVTEMTIAAGVAAGFGLPILLVGAAAAVAIGGVIGSNWDSIAEYGQRIWDDMETKGQNPAGLVDETNNTVTMSPDLINSAARTVDTMPATISVTSGTWNPLASSTNTGFGAAIPAGAIVRFAFDYTFVDNNASYDSYFQAYVTMNGTQFKVMAGENFYPLHGTGSMSGHMELVTPASMEAGIIDKLNVSMNKFSSTTMTISNLNYMIDTTGSDGVTKTYDTSENFGMTADNVYQRELYANSMLSANQVLTLSDSMDLTNATMEDVLSVQNSTYDETKTQTGILSNIWTTIKGIPSNIAAAGVAASLAINAKAEDLWQDAGAVWTGLADTAVGIKADVNAKMGALQDAMAGGIDNVRTNIDNMRIQLGAGIDSLTTSAAAWFTNVGVKIDTGIDTLTGKLTDVWTGVAAIPAAIAAVPADIVTSLTDLAVPTAAQTAENNTNMSNTRLLLASKFEWIRIPIEEIKSLYGQRRSFFDVSVVVMGQEVVLLPAAYAATVAVVRNVMSGTMIMMTIIFIYRRVQPSDVV